MRLIPLGLACLTSYPPCLQQDVTLKLAPLFSTCSSQCTEPRISIAQSSPAMFADRISLFILFLAWCIPRVSSGEGPSRQPSPSEIIPSRRPSRSKIINDCRAAMELMPRGVIIDVDGTARSTKDAPLPRMVDRRKRILPAEFYSGCCVIQVRTDKKEGPSPAGAPPAATAMYFVG